MNLTATDPLFLLPLQQSDQMVYHRKKFADIKQRMWAQLSSGYCILVVVTIIWWQAMLKTPTKWRSLNHFICTNQANERWTTWTTFSWLWHCCENMSLLFFAYFCEWYAGSYWWLVKIQDHQWGLSGKILFCSWKLALSNYVIVFSVSVVVFVEINWKHYFWSNGPTRSAYKFLFTAGKKA